MFTSYQFPELNRLFNQYFLNLGGRVKCTKACPGVAKGVPTSLKQVKVQIGHRVKEVRRNRFLVDLSVLA